MGVLSVHNTFGCKGSIYKLSVKNDRLKWKCIKARTSVISRSLRKPNLVNWLAFAPVVWNRSTNSLVLTFKIHTDRQTRAWGNTETNALLSEFNELRRTSLRDYIGSYSNPIWKTANGTQKPHQLDNHMPSCQIIVWNWFMAFLLWLFEEKKLFAARKTIVVEAIHPLCTLFCYIIV